mgnify:CR=1 FL=1
MKKEYITPKIAIVNFVTEHLLAASVEKESIGVVEDLGTPIGYLYISSMVRDEVFLEYAVLKEERGKGYGSDIIRETTDYLFQNHNIIFF